MKNLTKKLFAFGMSLWLLAAAFALPATVRAAETAETTAAEATSQVTPVPYRADTSLPQGTIIQFDEKDAAKVVPASITDLAKMHGAIVSPEGLPITVGGNATIGQVYVSTGGNWDVLVTNENGAIKTGDMVTLSNLKGTAMKSSTDQAIIFGKALESFDGKDNVIGQSALKYDNGKTAKTVSIGLIKVAIDIRANPDVHSTKTKLPPVLERLGEQIADKELSPFRIYLSVAIVVIGVILTIVILYSGIRNSILAVGRNPLSKKTIFRGLTQVIFVAFIVLIIALFTVYLLLKL